MKHLPYLLFLIGLTIFLFPHVGMIADDLGRSATIAAYDQAVDSLDESQLQQQQSQLVQDQNPSSPGGAAYYDPFSGGVRLEDSKLQTVNDDGVFGYLDIPRINERLPIYLGATSANLGKGVAQIEGTSLPIGGSGTHSVIAGHRGWRGTPVFRYVDELKSGDEFYIHVYGKVLTYEVVGQEVILPAQSEKLEIDPAKDQVTLLTCTPYLVGTRRLLIHSIRIPATTEADANPDDETSTSVAAEPVVTVSPAARANRIFTYLLVGAGSVLWVAVCAMWIRSYRNKGTRTP